MKAVGQASEVLRPRGAPASQAALRALMRHLIDTVYLDLTKPNVDKAQWLSTREKAEQLLAQLEAACECHTSSAFAEVGRLGPSARSAPWSFGRRIVDIVEKLSLIQSRWRNPH